jgi:transposase
LSVIQGSRGATALVGMPGLVVGAQQVIDGELWLLAETDADFMGCSRCGTRATGHGRHKTLVRDLPVAGRPTVLCVAKRRWRCVESNCDVNTWTEKVPGIAPRAVLTERARKRIAEMVNQDGDSIAAAAASFGVGWHTANQAVVDFTDPHVDDPDRLVGVEAIGVDEKRFLNATPTSRTRYTTQIVDLDRHQVLDVLEGRSRDVVGDWLSERGTDWCENIRLATLDPSAGYRRALQDHLPEATLVVDHWHVVRLANRAIDQVRRRVQNQTLGTSGTQKRPAVSDTAGPSHRLRTAHRHPLRVDVLDAGGR